MEELEARSQVISTTLSEEQCMFSLIYFSEFLLQVHFLWHFTQRER